MKDYTLIINILHLSKLAFKENIPYHEQLTIDIDEKQESSFGFTFININNLIEQIKNSCEQHPEKIKSIQTNLDFTCIPVVQGQMGKLWDGLCATFSETPDKYLQKHIFAKKYTKDNYIYDLIKKIWTNDIKPKIQEKLELIIQKNFNNKDTLLQNYYSIQELYNKLIDEDKDLFDEILANTETPKMRSIIKSLIQLSADAKRLETHQESARVMQQQTDITDIIITENDEIFSTILSSVKDALCLANTEMDNSLARMNNHSTTRYLRSMAGNNYQQIAGDIGIFLHSIKTIEKEMTILIGKELDEESTQLLMNNITKSKSIVLKLHLLPQQIRENYNQSVDNLEKFLDNVLFSGFHMVSKHSM
tara:strand:- start:41048 stop:42136 length:1089 start_codon:yes stop_codon:yes gene_type:complete